MFTSSCSEDWWRGRFVSIAEFFSRWRSRIFASEVFFFHLGENLLFIHSCLRSHYKPEMSINSHECRDVTENFISSLYAGKLCQGFVGLLIRYNFKRGSSPFFIASFVLWMSVAWITRSAEHCDLAFTYVIKYSSGMVFNYCIGVDRQSSYSLRCENCYFPIRISFSL